MAHNRFEAPTDLTALYQRYRRGKEEGIRTLTFRRKARIHSQDDSSHNLRILIGGRVLLSGVDISGHQIGGGLASPVSLFFEPFSNDTQLTHPYDAEAFEDCQLIEIEKPRLADVFGQDIDLSRVILSAAKADNLYMTRRNRVLQGHGIEQPVAAMVLDFTSGATLPLTATESQLALQAGVTYQSVSALYKDWITEDLLERAGLGRISTRLSRALRVTQDGKQVLHLISEGYSLGTAMAKRRDLIT
ncbi:MAG TPA: hypothetical protein VJG66_02485 [Patescibacteria group bacterium]|nr:hypothetical protein [Patescibacteria group bacterium]